MSVASGDECPTNDDGSLNPLGCESGQCQPSNVAGDPDVCMGGGKGGRKKKKRRSGK